MEKVGPPWRPGLWPTLHKAHTWSVRGGQDTVPALCPASPRSKGSSRRPRPVGTLSAPTMGVSARLPGFIKRRIPTPTSYTPTSKLPQPPSSPSSALRLSQGLCTCCPGSMTMLDPTKSQKQPHRGLTPSSSEAPPRPHPWHVHPAPAPHLEAALTTQLALRRLGWPRPSSLSLLGSTYPKAKDSTCPGSPAPTGRPAHSQTFDKYSINE